MSTACLVLFHRYEPSGRGNYNILFDYFLRHVSLWGDAIDKFYVIDSGPGITKEAESKLRNTVKEAVVYKRKSTSHWDNMNFAIPKIQEDKMLLIDGDTIFSQLAVVQNIFDDLDTHQIVSMTDTSGGIDLFDEFDILKENKYRAKRRRLAPYLFACHTELFRRIGPYDFTPLSGDRWTDSMGWISKQLLDLNPTFKEIPDDRSSLYYREDGNHLQSAFLDDPTFEWSKNTQNNYGYYHVRNWNGGLFLVENKVLSPVEYHKALSIMPQQEGVRLLAWLYLMTENNNYKIEIKNIAKDFGIQRKAFDDYMDTFKKFHSWINLI